MKKRIISSILLVAMILSAAMPTAMASEAEYKVRYITVQDEGYRYTEKVLCDADGNIYVPVTWLTTYGMMVCEEEENRYVFYHVGDEKEKKFAKRIYVDKAGRGAGYGIFISKSEFEVITKVEFSNAFFDEGVLYLPLAEYLPLFNAKTEITRDGILHINENAMSVFSALAYADVKKLAFDLDEEVAYGRNIQGTAEFVDTILNGRWDRLMGSSGDIKDYSKVFTTYLMDDEVYLSAFDQDTSPVVEMINEMRDTLWEIAKGIVNGETERTEPEIEPDLEKEQAAKNHLDYATSSGEYDGISWLAEFGGMIDGAEKNAYLLTGVCEALEYQYAYANHIKDHRRMLDAVYLSGYYTKNGPAATAARNTSKLYGDDYADRLLAGTQAGLRDALVELAGVAFDKATEDLFKPFQIANLFTKAIIPETYDYFENTALWYCMDGATRDAMQVYKKRCSNLQYDEESLRDLRLSAMMVLVASRHAYTTIWSEDHPKVAPINEALKRIYLAGDSVRCESCEYYEAEYTELQKRIGWLKFVGEEERTFPLAEDLLHNCCWIQYDDRSASWQYVALFELDGTFRSFHHGVDIYDGGTYQYDAANGVLTMQFASFGDSQFKYSDGKFVMIDDYGAPVEGGHMILEFSPGDKAYFEEQPVETEPSETEPLGGMLYGEQYDELVGHWYAYEPIVGYDYTWFLHLNKDGTGSIGMGMTNLETDEYYDIRWAAEEDSNGYYVTMVAQDNSWRTFVYTWLEDGKIYMVRNDGEPENVVADVWYERDLDYKTWLDRQKGEEPPESRGKYSALGTWVASEMPSPAGLVSEQLEITEDKIRVRLDNSVYEVPYEEVEYNGYTCLLTEMKGTAYAYFVLNEDMMACAGEAFELSEYRATIRGREYDIGFRYIYSLYVRPGSGTPDWPRPSDENEIYNMGGRDRYYIAHYCTGKTGDEHQYMSSSRKYSDQCAYHELGWFDSLDDFVDDGDGLLKYCPNGKMHRCSNTCYYYFVMDTEPTLGPEVMYYPSGRLLQVWGEGVVDRYIRDSSGSYEPAVCLTLVGTPGLPANAVDTGCGFVALVADDAPYETFAHVEYEGRHDYVLLEAPFLEGNSMTTYLWYDKLELDTWIAEGGGGYICDLAVYWDDLYVGFDTSMFLTNCGYEEDGRVFIQGTRLEDGRDVEYLIGEDGQLAMILGGNVYTGEFAGIRYGEFVTTEIASDCVYLDHRCGESKRVTRYELQEYLNSEPNRGFIYITVTFTAREDGVYITQIEIPYFP